jgi:molybdopterin biosynthesis enzyme
MPQVAPVPWEGSGDLAAMARANCFLVVPEAAHRSPKAHLQAGDIVRILLF